MPPFGLDSDDYIAAFSNAGIEVDLTAPGAGVGLNSAGRVRSDERDLDGLSGC